MQDTLNAVQSTQHGFVRNTLKLIHESIINLILVLRKLPQKPVFSSGSKPKCHSLLIAYYYIVQGEVVIFLIILVFSGFLVHVYPMLHHG